MIASNSTPAVVATPTEILFSTAAVPEPTSVVMLGSGLAGLLALAWSRRTRG